MKPTHITHNMVFLGAACFLAILHICSWSDYPPDVDPINFTLALHTYSPSIDAPHPPGYPLFVFTGRLAAYVVGDRHAYQLVNLGMLFASGCFLYFTFRRAGNVELGIFSALLLMSHPLAWSATVVPECYISDTFFATGILAWVYCNSDSQKKLVAGIFVLFFLMGMVRPVSGVMLLPLAMAVGYYCAEVRSFRNVVFVVIAGILAIILAYAITAILSGGLTAYRSAAMRVMGGAFHANSLLGGAAFSNHMKMLAHLLGWFLLLVLPTGVLIFVAALNNRNLVQAIDNKSAIIIGYAWLLPPLLFYALIYYLKPTYQLIYLPCLLIPCAWVLTLKDGFFSKRARTFAFLALVMAQLVFFLVPFGHLPQPLFRITESYVIQQDQAWGSLMDNLSKMPKEDTLLIWVSHPSLSMYAVRLINKQEPIALASTDRSELNYLIPQTMEWLPSNLSDKIINEKYKGAIIIENIRGQATVRNIKFSDPQWRVVNYLLNNYLSKYPR